MVVLVKAGSTSRERIQFTNIRRKSPGFILRLSHEQIKAKLSSPQSPKSSAFVELVPPTLKEENNNINLGSKVELKRADGASMIIEHLTESHLANLLNVFMRGE